MTNLNAANISKLIWYMEGLDDPRFTMEKVHHNCGAPACAFGHAKTIFTDATGRCATIFGGDAWQNLFTYSLCYTIHTPQQWALHARKVLADAGLEVEPNAAPQVGNTQDSATADDIGSCTRHCSEKETGAIPAVAAPYDFQAFMGRVLEPVTTKEKA